MQRTRRVSQAARATRRDTPAPPQGGHDDTHPPRTRADTPPPPRRQEAKPAANFDDMDDAFEDYVRELTTDQIADHFDNFAKKYPRVVVAKSLYELLED